LKRAEEYRESVAALQRTVYYLGQTISDVTAFPATAPHVNAAAEAYAIAFEPEHQDLAVAYSDLCGSPVNRFTYIHKSPEDLVKKVRLLRSLGQRTGTCFQRCAGWDALHTMYILTYEIDRKYGTTYHERYLRFLRYVQENDLMVAAGMTDPKGDRSRPPCQQIDPDLYLRVVSVRHDGIVVRGAKAHQTGGVNAHEVLVLPTTALRQEDRDYAVAFAVPVDTKGLTFVFGRQTNDGRKLEGGEFDTGNPRFGMVGGEALIVFDDVFVPMERVFMLGEFDMAGRGVEVFASTHRQNYGGCKVGVMDCLIGATSLIARYHGVDRASHIRDKLAEMVHLNETLFGCALAAGLQAVKTPSGAYMAHPLLANTVKLNVTRYIYEIARLAHDITGGILATLPSEADFRHPAVGPLVAKYLQTVPGVPPENRFRVIRLIECLTGTAALVEAMHGAGSPQAQKVLLLRQANLAHKEELALKLCGLAP
jgi:4-hydroxybutyryl-CoA dehydratase/vinylacetyl-CoA-Delta-isomerase